MANPKTLNKTQSLDDDDFQDPSPSQLHFPKPTSRIAALRPYNSTKKPKQHSSHGGSKGKENFVLVGKWGLNSGPGYELDSSRPTKKPKQQPVSSKNDTFAPIVEKADGNEKKIEFEDLDLGHGLDTSCPTKQQPVSDDLAPVVEKSDENGKKSGSDFEDLDLCHGLDSIESTIDCCSGAQKTTNNEEELKRGYLFKSIEARLLNSNGGFEEKKEEELEEESELDLLLKLCGEEDQVDVDLHSEEECLGLDNECGRVCCPLCGVDISDLSDEMRQVHTNECLDKEETPTHVVTANNDVSFQSPGQVLNNSPCQSPREVVHMSPVVEWLRNLGLAKYEEIFVREEIDWDTLKSLTEEDLFGIGVTALGPRKKIVNSIMEIRKETAEEKVARQDVTKNVPVDAGTKPSKLITDYFICPVSERKKVSATGREQTEVGKTCSIASRKRIQKKHPAKSAKSKDIPVWCSIPGTPFRVYDFPKQEAVIQFVIESIQAETFNSKTLFLIGSYTIGKERVFVEVARALQKKVYVSASKLRILECLGFTEEEMQFFTSNEQESQIHVVPMWTLASFKRLKYVSNQYAGRYSLIVAFSPTGWSFGKGKKKSTGSRWQQGTIIRYEVPYSEHSSFSELKEFVKFVSPVNIIPSVNNHGPESSSAMVSRVVD